MGSPCMVKGGHEGPPWCHGSLLQFHSGGTAGNAWPCLATDPAGTGTACGACPVVGGREIDDSWPL